MLVSERTRQRLGLQILFDFNDIIDAVRFASEHGLRVLELNLGNINFARQMTSSRERQRIRAEARRQKVTLSHEQSMEADFK